jgi:hypothetical protein
MAGHYRETSGRPPTPAVAGQGDGRAGLRHSAVLRVAVLVRGGDSRQLCMVRNIATEGLMVRVFSDVEPGEPIAIELRADRQLAGRIVWIRDGNAGIRFDRPVEITDILAPPPPKPGWRMRLPRLQVDRLAMIRSGSEISFADARCISQGGVRVVCERPLENGTPVILTLEGFRPLEGVVRWNRDGFCGISFNQVIPPGDLNRWLAS